MSTTRTTTTIIVAITIAGTSIALVGCFPPSDVNWQDVPLSATWGTISSADAAQGRLNVTGDVYPRGATAYLGCTLYYANGTHDLQVISVSDTFTEFFRLPRIWGGRYTVALWRTKVVNCGCSYCRANGYHLEDRLTEKAGRF